MLFKKRMATRRCNSQGSRCGYRTLIKTNDMKKVEFTESEELVTGARVETSNQVPIELSAAVCLGCMLAFIIIFIVSLFL